MDINQFAYFFVPAFIIGEIVVRSILDWKKRRQTFPLKDVLINFSIGLIDRLVTTLFWTVIMYKAFVAIYQHGTTLRIDMSNWWAWPLALLLSDFAFYWYHRAGHEVRFLWAIHNVHHSSEHYNFSTSIRLSWLEGLFRWPFWCILPIAGFTPEVSMIAYMITRLYQVTLHNEYISKLGWLEHVLSTPSHHRVHHARNPQYLDKNYGGITILWDRLFGTFAREEEPVEYGLVKQLNSSNIVWINFHEYVSLWQDIRKAKRWQDRLLYLWHKPGWTPAPDHDNKRILGLDPNRTMSE
ncbi:MAG: sterol desaturase family protein [Oligoflexus sp.]|jgi:alkylglycerol monooxygenase